MGITPAYAGKRVGREKWEVNNWDHPRVCGEKGSKDNENFIGLGSPPRMRGKAGHSQGHILRHGITPAYAGKRPSLTSS